MIGCSWSHGLDKELYIIINTPLVLWLFTGFVHSTNYTRKSLMFMVTHSPFLPITHLVLWLFTGFVHSMNYTRKSLLKSKLSVLNSCSGSVFCEHQINLLLKLMVSCVLLWEPLHLLWGSTAPVFIQSFI